LSQLFAGENADVTLSGNVHVTDWDDHFGLVSDDGFDVGIDAAFRPHERVEVSAYYTYDWSELHQRSASSGGTLEWDSDHEDVGHTGGLDVAFAILPERLTLTTGSSSTVEREDTCVRGTDRRRRLSRHRRSALDAVREPPLPLRRTRELHRGHRYEHYDQEDWQFDGSA
jgi:hypothetical protein